MIRVFSMNENRDIHSVGGRLQIATGIEAVLQTCERAMRVRFSEMIYATERGVDYFRVVFGSNPDVIQFESGARAQIMRVPGVTGIELFSATIQNNQLTYSVTINTEFGTDSINGTVSA